MMTTKRIDYQKKTTDKGNNAKTVVKTTSIAINETNKQLSRRLHKEGKKIKLEKECLDNVIAELTAKSLAKGLNHLKIRTEREKVRTKQREQSRTEKKSDDDSIIFEAQSLFGATVQLDPNLTEQLCETLATFRTFLGSEEITEVVPQAESPIKLQRQKNFSDMLYDSMSKMKDKTCDDVSQKIQDIFPNLTLMFEGYGKEVGAFVAVVIFLYVLNSEQTKITKIVICVIAGVVFHKLGYVNLKDLFTDLVSKIDMFSADDDEEIECQGSTQESDGGIGLGAFVPTMLATIFMGTHFLSREKSKRDNIISTISSYVKDYGNITVFFNAVVQVAEYASDLVCDYVGIPRFLKYGTDVDVVDKWLTDCWDLEYHFKTKSLEISQATAQKVCCLIEQGVKWLKVSPDPHKNSTMLNKINSMITRMDKIQMYLVSNGIYGRGNRVEPVLMVLKGASGIGKSTLLRPLVYEIMSLVLQNDDLEKFVKDPDSFVYARNPEAKHWDGYRGQPVLFYDEWGMVTNSKTEASNHATDIIRMVNPFDFPLHMADLVSKGSEFFKSELIVCTSNVTNVRTAVEENVSFSDAVVRRFDFDVQVVIKDEFALNETGSNIYSRTLDKSKVLSGAFNEKVYMFHLFQPGTDHYSSKPVAKLDFHSFAELVATTYLQKKDRANCQIQSCGRFISEGISRREKFLAKMYGPTGPVECQMDPQPDVNFVTQEDGEANESFRTAEEQWFTDLNLPTDIEVESEDIEADLNTVYHEKAWEELKIMVDPEDTRALFAFLRRVEEYSFDRSEWDPVESIRTFGADYTSDSLYGFMHYFVTRIMNKRVTTVNFFPEFTINFRSWMVLHSEAFKLAWEMKGYEKSPIYYELFEIVEEREKHRTGWRSYLESIRNRLSDKMWRLAFLQFTVSAATTALLTYGAFKVLTKGLKAIGGWVSGSLKKKSKMDINDLVVEAQLSDQISYNLMQKVLSKSVYSFKVNDHKLGYCFFLKSNLMVVPNHFLLYLDNKGGSAQIEMKQLQSDYVLNYEYSDIKNLFTRYPDDDQAYAHLPKCRNHPDLTSSLVGGGDFTKRESGKVYYVRMRDELPICEVVKYSVGRKVIRYNILSTEIKLHKNLIYETVTQRGECGMPIFLVDKSSRCQKLVGFHVAGAPNMGIGISCILNDHAYGCEAQMELETMKKVGTVTLRPGLNSRSKIRKSELFEIFGPALTAPAKLRPFKNADGEIINPFEKAFSGYDVKRPQLDKRIAEGCIANYFSYLIENQFEPINTQILSFKEACTGIPSEDFIDAIPRNTSPGFPWNCRPMAGKPGKERFFGSGADYSFNTKDCIELEEMVYDQIGQLKKGIRPKYYFTGCLKDERRKHSKVESGDTRYFSACPVDYAIICAMYTKRFVQWVCKNRIYNGCSVGINPYSSEWGMLVKIMREVGTFAEDGDFKHFDKIQPVVMLRKIAEWICVVLNYEGEDKKLVETLWMEVYQSRHIVGTEIYEWDGSLPSGHPLTTIVNVIINHALHRYAWVCLHNFDMQSLKDFPIHVGLQCFGDDSIKMISDTKINVFNTRTIASVLGKYGITYTNGQKQVNVDDQDFIHLTIDDVTYLKRGFRFCSIANRIVAPLALDTITEMVYWTREGETMEETKRVNVNTALMELSLHPEDVFKTYSTVLIKESVAKLKYLPPIVDRRELILFACGLEKHY